MKEQYIICWTDTRFENVQPQKVEFSYFKIDNGFNAQDVNKILKLNIAEACMIDNSIITRIK